MRIGLIGVGHWHAHMHAEAVVSAGAALGPVWNPEPEIVERFAAQHQMVGADEAEAVIEGSSLVVVMGRPDTVPALAEMMIAAGTPFILEKPAATDTATLKAIARATCERGMFAAVPLPNRLGPIMRECNRLSAMKRWIGRECCAENAALRRDVYHLTQEIERQSETRHEDAS